MALHTNQSWCIRKEERPAIRVVPYDDATPRVGGTFSADLSHGLVAAGRMRSAPPRKNSAVLMASVRADRLTCEGGGADALNRGMFPNISIDGGQDSGTRVDVPPCVRWT